MVMDGNYMHGLGLRTAKLGVKVERALSTCPQSTASAIFNIVGGQVQMTLIIGTITTILGAVGNMRLEENPTTGTTELICTNVAAGTYAAGDLMGISGVPSASMLPAATGGIPGMTTQGVNLRIGTLDWRCSASSTGAMSWTMFYIPLEDGAYVTAA
jgi:hypothetical protein